ncbi:ABC transporter ATP-binding protein [Xylanimonas oleitrophica]|uniref:ABC transporter ATP-binding protein n=1 Tax=Xylanimonas oleitrophica TaxID=2607479 RepID=A0A2W5WXG3_9MICO|nr:ATP-binding cassette domain-containing protein [Xylanimonas oleitrophica]PZR55342.1 ABC transporter ATP-binding protein [Xylanimonas oleitrophica]
MTDLAPSRRTAARRASDQVSQDPARSGRASLATSDRLQDEAPLGVDARRVRWTVDGRLVLDDVDATAPPGAVSGLLGPNGAGKSTLLRLVAGVQRPDGGRVHLVGGPVPEPGQGLGQEQGEPHVRTEDLLAMPRRRRARLLALVEQDAATDLPLTVLDAVLLGRTPHRGLLAGDSDDDRAVAAAALERAGAADLAGRLVGTLSGGERQRVHLARALAQEPRVLLLDEPTNHLDVAAQLATMSLVRSLAAQGVTVLAALHDLTLAAQACDHVVVLAPGTDGGRVVAAGPVEEVLVPEVLDPVYGVRTTVLRHPSTGRPVLTFEPA